MVDNAPAAAVVTTLSLAQCQQVVELYAQLDQANALAACIAKPDAVVSVGVTLRSQGYVGSSSYATTTTKLNVIAAIKAEADASRAAIVAKLVAMGYKV